MATERAARGLLTLAGVAQAFGVFIAVSLPASAEFRLCAFRSGPKGPCTCQSDGDAAGQFSVVNRSLCRRGGSAAAKKKDPDVPSTAAAGARNIDRENAKEVPPANDGPVERSGQTQLPVATNPIVTGQAGNGGSRLDQIRARGHLLCGVNPALLGFAHRTAAGNWAGIDVDFCRAVAAAVLEDATKVEFVPLEAAARFEALKSGKIDLLSRNTTWTMGRDVDGGLEFAGVLYFDGQSFATGEDRGLVSAQQLAGSRVCVQSGTTTEANMAYYFSSHKIAVETQTFPSREALLKAYLDGSCDAYSADRSSLFSDRAGFEEPLKHAILPEVISKEPLGPAVLQGDQEWVEIVRWTLAGLINAEEVGLDKSSAAGQAALEGDKQRLVVGASGSAEKLRLNKMWLRNAVAAVGNYGELFETNLGSASPLNMDRGINALWKKGGILYAPPMW
jgi:general L-amino acid transport system substrate-binding protein